MSRLFGTDGVRGLANGELLTAPFALDLAIAAARVLAPAGEGDRPRVVVGRDPRASGEFLEAAVTAGLASAGADVLRAGVLPTPALAHLTAVHDAAFGVMLSASHNPAPDNGIKLFARGGHKLDDALEDAVAAAVGESAPRPTGAGVGRVHDLDGEASYVDHLLGALPHRLDGLTVVVDCAHGAASRVAPEALRRAGAEVIVIGAEPDGLNINEGCGSTHLEPLQAAVVEHGADAGIAHDGDADRCLAVDHTGAVVDGDQVLAVLAIAARAAGRLARDTLVVTVMSNLGLHLAMRDAGIEVVQTPVGDRYVLEAMRAGGYTLGGEQSGHVVALDHATTGDGPLTALLLLAEVARSGRRLRDLAAVVTRLPQVLVNVRGVDRERTDDAELLAAVREAEVGLADEGRVLLRPSGTEPVVRVMVEAPTEERAQAVATSLADVVRQRLAL